MHPLFTRLEIRIVARMTSWIKKSIRGLEARKWTVRFLAISLLASGFASWLIAGDQHSTAPDLTVHEWGTFTAIAGKNGRAVEWSTLAGSNDLPSFVEHISAANFKSGLRGTIRMETPVLYFYSPHDEVVSVEATFSRGLITEWYPHASRVEPERVSNSNLSQSQTDGSIAWTDVSVSPNLGSELPRDIGLNRYYAARETASAPLRVKTARGEQQEKFLFYRGVSTSPLPLSVEQRTDGNLVVRNLSTDVIPAIILFERRGERVGFRVSDSLTDETGLHPPALTDSQDAVMSALETILINQGIYPDEAHAMIDTWRDSWFEEGTRLIYIVPRGFIDAILPLKINPAPGQVVRVFVGRLEIVTPSTALAVKTAVASKDEVTLNKYRRFLEPILDFVKAEEKPGGTAAISHVQPSGNRAGRQGLQ